MASKFALEKAAQAWTTKSTCDLAMQPELAEAFADIIDALIVRPAPSFSRENLFSAIQHYVDTVNGKKWDELYEERELVDCPLHGKNVTCPRC